jgi:hypothetical protein
LNLVDIASARSPQAPEPKYVCKLAILLCNKAYSRSPEKCNVIAKKKQL